MIDPWSEARLAQVLASVGEHLDTDPATAVIPSASRRRPEWSARQWLVAAAAIAAVLGGITLAFAPVREAVADFLGIGSTEVDVVPPPEANPAGLPTIDDGLTTITQAEATSRLGASLPDTSATQLGQPDLIAAMPEGGVVLVWSDSATTLWIHAAALPTVELTNKLVAAGQDVRPIDGLGEAALMIRGPHVLETPHRRVAAGTVVLWSRGRTEYRLESDLDETTMLDIAHAHALALD